MRKFSADKGDVEELAEVNITPLTDLSLTLLIMLMLISPMMVQSMINVVSSTAVQSQTKEDLKEKPLYIDVTEKGIFLNSNKMKSKEDLFLKLKGEISRKRDKTVLVTVAKKVKHGSMVEVLDLAKQAGAKELSLLKRKT